MLLSHWSVIYQALVSYKTKYVSSGLAFIAIPQTLSQILVQSEIEILWPTGLINLKTRQEVIWVVSGVLIEHI